MAGMPNLNNDFTGGQTENSSYYNAIEDYSESGGYYIKIGDDAPVDPRLAGENPEIVVYSDESMHAPDGGNYTTDFEIIPMPEEDGGKISKTIRFSIKNNNLVTPLELTGTPLVHINGDESFELLQQPLAPLIAGGSRATFDLRFTSDPESPGIYSTLITIPNSDPLHADYTCTVSINAINNTYFVDSPIYYNQCESEDDFLFPLIGSQFEPEEDKKWNGGKKGWDFVSHTFGKGYRVYCRGRDSRNYAKALIYPFTVEKPSLSKGTCAYWASSQGAWRGKDRNTWLDSKVLFRLTDSVYTIIHTKNKHDNGRAYLVVDGVSYGVCSVPANSIAQYILQWDLVDGFNDGTNLKFYCNGQLQASTKSSLTVDEVNNVKQYFQLEATNTNDGSHSAKSPGATAIIDNIIIWNTVVDPETIIAIKQ
jgi:hypothetical protein